MKKVTFLLLAPIVAFAETAPVTFPVFLKAGFSSVLEFEEPPTKVVLGDSQSFQVERLDSSLVVKTVTPYAATNLFVYFKTKPTRLFVLTANEDSEPTYYRKFGSITPPKPVAPRATPVRYVKGARLLKADFDSKKDYLTVEALISTNSTAPIIPDWDSVRLVFRSASLKPSKLWAERKAVQKDSAVKVRFIFTKPNVPRNLKGASIVIPVPGESTPLQITLGGVR